jgi:hypothetical protein
MALLGFVHSSVFGIFQKISDFMKPVHKLEICLDVIALFRSFPVYLHQFYFLIMHGVTGLLLIRSLHFSVFRAVLLGFHGNHMMDPNGNVIFGVHFDHTLIFSHY